MMTSGAALVVKALEDEGVELVFGIPGTHNIELYDALAPASFCPGAPVARDDIALLAAGQAPRYTCAAVW